MPFYAAGLGESLRFGDVVRGFPRATPIVHSLVVDHQKDEWSMKLVYPQHLVVMTPCCAIEQSAIVLAPLQHVRWSFFNNPYLAGDLTRINGRMTTEQSMVPAEWARLTEEDKAARTAEGMRYAVSDVFIYAPADALPPYEIARGRDTKECSHYMVDFKAVFRVESNGIQRGKPPPVGAKVLELSVSARKLLRDKVGVFYDTPPAEDLAAGVEVA